MDHINQDFDMSYIKKMSAGDAATEKQLLEILLEELQNDLPRASDLLEDEDWEGLDRFCHHFKSTIAFTGNSTMINANLKLWAIAKKRGKSSAKGERILASMQSLAKRIEREVISLLKKCKYQIPNTN